MGKGYNGLMLIASGYEHVRAICQMAYGMTETIMLQEVLDLLGLVTLFWQLQILGNDIPV